MIMRRQMGEKGQVVIPKDIREFLGLKEGNEVIFEIEDNEVKIKPEQDPKEFLKDFLNVPTPKKRLTWKKIKKDLEERHDVY